MKKYYLTSLACAITLVSACSSMPSKQETAQIEQPVAAPLTLQKVEAETSAPHYRLNPKNYFTPLNPILVKEITDALTPKIINPATGEVVQRLPIVVPKKAEVAAQTVAISSNDSANNDNVMTSAATAQTPEVQANDVQDTEAALLQIDPSLKLHEQAATAFSVTTSPTAVQATQNATGEVTPNDTAALQTQDNTKILIPLHQQLTGKTNNLSTPAPTDEIIDVTEVDKDLTLIEGKARHYPTYFSNKIERYKAEKKIKQLTQKLDLIAVDPRASYEVLLRAMKAHVLSRNMDVGPDAAFKSAVYIQRLLKLQPNDPETSFWYGFTLGEGGGFKESIPHLDKAMKADYQEAYLSLAHSYLQMDHKKDALTMLNNYKIKFPDDAANTDRLIGEIEAGKRYSIWQ